MTTAEWERAKALLAEAAERPPAERERLVRERCSDPDLRREILALLASPAPLSEIVTRAVLPIGSRLGPYRIEAFAGRGGMGEVYRARDTRLGRDVAVKILPASFAGNPEPIARFEREGRLLASVNHPHICALFDVGEQDGTPFLVMEYVDGEALSERLTRGPLPVGEAVRRAIEIADALAKAHARGIVHRDLKPGNIMLTASGAKLLDFGLARPGTLVGASGDGTEVAAVWASMTREGTLLGTWRYMAPEQLEGHEADTRSDLWAFGCVLYEMLTGRSAFEGDSQPRLIASVLERTPPPPSAIRAAVAPALDHIVGCCLAKDPDDRWQSAADLRHELEWVAASSDQPAASPPLSKRSWRERIAWGLASLAAMVAAIAVTVTVAGRHGESPRPPMRFAVPLPGDIEEQRFFDLSPDGQYLAFVGTRRPAYSRSMVWVHSFRTLETRPLPGTEGDRSLPFWSPDARSIGFFADGKLKRIDVASGVVRIVCDAPNGRGGAWGPDGTIVFARDLDSPLYRVPAGGESPPAPVTRLGAAPVEQSHRMPSFLPDGRHFVFTVLGARGWYGLALGSTDAGPQTMLMTWQVDARSPYGSTQAYVSDDRLLFVRDGVLLAQHLDVERRRLTGDAAPLASRVFETDLGGQAFAVSRVGLLVYLPTPQGEQRQLTVITRGGSRTRTLWNAGAMSGLSLAPDGRRAAVEREDPQTGASEVWLLDLDRDTSSRLTSGRDAYGAVWSADGARVLFTSASSLANTDIYAQAADGSGREERIVESPAGSTKIPIGWSTSGGLLFSATNRAGGWDLWTLAAGSGRRPALLLDGKQRAQFQDAKVTRDGRLVAFGSAGEIYIQALPRGPRVLVADDGATQPHWRDDGRELYYIADGKLMAVTVRMKAGIELGAPETVFDIPTNVPPWSLAYAPLGDGQRFLFELPLATNAPPPLTAVLNWAGATALRH